MNEGGVAVSILTRTVFFPELPTAYADVDTTVNEGDTLILDGSGSSDPDGDIVTYLWSQMSGPSVTLSSDTAQSPTFVAPEVAETLIFTFVLVVSDGQADSQPDSVSITVNDVNKPPIANAGVDQRVDERDTLILDGSGSSDPDGDVLTYLWSQMSGPSVTLSDRTTESPTFILPEVAETLIFTFVLVVSDGQVDSQPDSVSITVNDVNKPPIANAGPDQTVGEGDRVVLNGSGSSDPDGDILTYLWSQVSGPVVTLSDRTIQSPTFILPDVAETLVLTFTLVVSDGEADSQSDSVRIVVKNVPEIIGDFNEDDEVGLADFVLFLDAFGSSLGGTAFDEKFDLDGDDNVELSDFVVFLDHFGERR